MDWLVEFAKQNGLEGLMFLAVCYAAKWFADNVVKPLVSAHIAFLDAYKNHMGQTDEWLECHAESLKTLAAHDGSNSQALERMASAFERLQCRGAR